ncbi:MAG: hypothetical protein JWO37_2072, partial [Acidimicrobiales bacterium]|nr:hypothetical protein [Acidimicrobiales bacterium]
MGAVQSTIGRLRRKVSTGMLIAGTAVLLGAVLLGDAATIASPDGTKRAFRDAVGAGGAPTIPVPAASVPQPRSGRPGSPAVG